MHEQYNTLIFRKIGEEVRERSDIFLAINVWSESACHLNELDFFMPIFKITNFLQYRFILWNKILYIPFDFRYGRFAFVLTPSDQCKILNNFAGMI